MSNRATLPEQLQAALVELSRSKMTLPEQVAAVRLASSVVKNDFDAAKEIVRLRARVETLETTAKPRAETVTQPSAATPAPVAASGEGSALLTAERDAARASLKTISDAVRKLSVAKSYTKKAEETLAAKGSPVATLESVTRQRDEAQRTLATVVAALDQLERPSLTKRAKAAIGTP